MDKQSKKIMVMSGPGEYLANWLGSEDDVWIECWLTHIYLG